MAAITFSILALRRLIGHPHLPAYHIPNIAIANVKVQFDKQKLFFRTYKALGNTIFCPKHATYCVFVQYSSNLEEDEVMNSRLYCWVPYVIGKFLGSSR